MDGTTGTGSGSTPLVFPPLKYYPTCTAPYTPDVAPDTPAPDPAPQPASFAKATKIISSSLPTTLNDEIIIFSEYEHSYRLVLPDGSEIQAKCSVTKFIDLEFSTGHPNFQKICDLMVAKRSYMNNEKYDFIPRQATEEHIKNLILASWNWKKNVASEYGTAMHYMIEYYYQHKEHLISPLLHREQQEFRKFLATDGAALDIVSVELRLFDRELNLAGSVDALFRHRRTGKYVLVDWKRSGIDSFEKTFRPKKYGLTNKCDKLNKYELQCNIYADILRHCYHLEISDMYLWIIDPNVPRASYVFHRVPFNDYVQIKMSQLRALNKTN